MQLTLLDSGERPGWCGFTPRVQRTWLDDASWVDVARGVVRGHVPLMHELTERVAWRAGERRMYERRVAIPRLTATIGEEALPPVVLTLHRTLSEHYGMRLPEVTFALYRDGDDSVAWHRDRELRDWDTSLVAILSLGGARNFQLRRYDEVRGRGFGPSLTLRVAWGDVLVMGGACQRRWEHRVPKMKHAEPRMAVMFRPRERVSPGRDPRFQDPRYSDPRYSDPRYCDPRYSE